MAEFDEFAGDYEDVLNDSLRWSSDSAEYFAMHKAQVLGRKLAATPPRHILDFGCGVGGVTRQLGQVFTAATIDGFDVSEDSLAAIPDELRERGNFASDLDALRSDYDLVVISNVLHHIEPRDRAGIMQDLGSRLGSKGRIAIFEHNPMNPVTRRIVATCPFDENAVLLWPSESLRLLRGAGLGSTGLDYVLFFPGFLGKLRPLEPHLAWCPFGAQYLAWGMR